MIITPVQHAALLGMKYSRPKLRAILGEALTEAEFVALKRLYLRLRREAGAAVDREGAGGFRHMRWSR